MQTQGRKRKASKRTKEREDLVNLLLSLHPLCLWHSPKGPPGGGDQVYLCSPELGYDVALSHAGANVVHSGGSHVFRVP